MKSVLEKRDAILQKRKRRLKRKSQLSNRGSHAVQQRMKLLANMAASHVDGGENDTFGAHDEDWDVYRQASLDINMDSESDEEKLQISKFEELLNELDPSLHIKSVLDDGSDDEAP